MQGDPRHFTGGGNSVSDYQQRQDYFHNVGSYSANDGLPAPSYCDNYRAGSSNGCPGGKFKGIELQASENCPRNFVIFDQTNSTSRIMYNPLCAEKLGYPVFDIPMFQAQGSKRILEKDVRYISSASFQEDSEEIDALLSLGSNDDGDEEDDVVSTGRTPGGYDCSSPDSTCSAAASRCGKQRCSYAQHACTAGPSGERKRERVKEMVKALRGIVPGGRKMDTPAFLDEAVKYLKSLKVEANKLGIQSSKNQLTGAS